ncbi:MAG: hypothetical protein KKD44_03735 [Proteobacteria bacterium]|nr:hypothetical protein [Pseudomonadota bacterium]
MKHFKCFINSIYDALEKTWAGPRGHRLASSLLVVCFILAMGLVELKRMVQLPDFMVALVPKNHLAAIEATLTLLLIIEVMGLIFSLVKSVTTSVGRQLEILSLILLRNVFKQISHLGEPLIWSNFSDEIGHISATSLSAIAIFAILSLFYRIKKEDVLSGDEEDKNHFILAKKTVALGLLVSFHLILINSMISKVFGGLFHDPFESFYTLLIISDILILFISMRYGHDYQIAFRNSGFAVVTVFIRISLISTPYFSALIGAGSALFALGTLYIYSLFIRHHPDRDIIKSSQSH